MYRDNAAAMPFPRWLISNMTSISQQPVEPLDAISQRPAIICEDSYISDKIDPCKGATEKTEQEGSERKSIVRFVDGASSSEMIEKSENVHQKIDFEEQCPDIFSQFDLPEQVRFLIKQQSENIALLKREVANLQEKKEKQHDAVYTSVDV